MDASLIMRDRETDSWWSIMTSDSIGGPLDGADLEELPYSEKATWGEWKAKHPDTVILSVNGVEHELNNPYDNYLESEGTFRDLEISDKRLRILGIAINGEAKAYSLNLLNRHEVVNDRFADLPVAAVW